MADYQLRPFTAIHIQQITPRPPGPTGAIPSLLSINFNFCHSWEGSETWTELTNKGKLTLPKNVYCTNATTGQPYNLAGTNKAQQLNTLFMRGDAVEIATGYYRYDGTGSEVLDQTQVYTGFITKVNSKIPIVLELEDNMWLCKQIPCTPQVWPRTKTVEAMLNTLLAGAINPGNGQPLTVNALTSTTIGDFIIEDETVAQVLARLRKDFHLEAYFTGNQLNIGSLVYIPPNPMPSNVPGFVFQKNIISDELSYQRKDDIKLSAVCESINTVFTGTSNKKGQPKTKQQRLTVLVWSDNKGGWKYMVKQKDVPFPQNEEGERRSLFFHFGLQDSGTITITDAYTLAQAGVAELAKYYYEGFKGKFTTFAIPDINLGDYIAIQDTVLPDRNGFYVVKGVEKSGGVGGGRQIIELAYKLISANGTLTAPPVSNPVLSQPPGVALPPGIVTPNSLTPLGKNQLQGNGTTTPFA